MSTTTPAEAGHPNPWFVGVVSGMASYIDSCAIVSAGTALVIYQQSKGFSDSQVGLASSSLTFAIAFGALFGGRLGDRFGRKPVFSATMALIVCGSVLQVLAPGFTALLIGTIMVGFGTGADLPVSLATISETATDKNRGAIIGLSNLLWTAGILGAIGCATVVGDWGLRGGQILYAQVGVVALIVLLARLPIPESRVWLVARAERAEVLVSAHDGELVVTVGDDGVGVGGAPEGIGLTGMRSRVESLGGTLVIAPLRADGAGGRHGTVIEARMPL